MSDPPAPSCGTSNCPADAAFRFYDRDAGTWTPRCERHALEIHPSLELHALLESGYLRPVEVGPPDGPPAAPVTPRGEAFRESVEELLGWSA